MSEAAPYEDVYCPACEEHIGNVDRREDPMNQTIAFDRLIERHIARGECRTHEDAIAEYRRPLFGDRWDAPVCDNVIPVPTPVGQLCLLCEEPIEKGDRGWLTSYVGLHEHGVRPVHAECELRSSVGSIGHQMGQCSCFGGSGNGDPEGMSRHNAARLVWKHFGLPHPAGWLIKESHV